MSRGEEPALHKSAFSCSAAVHELTLPGNATLPGPNLMFQQSRNT